MRGFVTGVMSSALVWLIAGSFQAPQAQVLERFNGAFKHVAFVVRDVQQSAKVYADVFGVDVPQIRNINGIVYPSGYRGDRKAGIKLANLMLNGLQLDLLEPVGGSSPWRDFLDEHGEGLHHISFGVTGLRNQVAVLERKGGRLTLGEPGVSGYAYVDMKPFLPFTLELEGK